MERGARRRALRIRRVELDYSQTDVALGAGIEFNRYWRIENEVIDPTDDEQKAIAKTLKAKRSDLFPAKQGAVA